ncbi:MAG TPA: nucleotidyl transferase AbiEii/AbiGii toxin family protein [Balneolaceae bacterium]|nr:nucleotidyl transferase AbiEii/AbiGii toxin family protein [Balneolaceae bacterium]
MLEQIHNDFSYQLFNTAQNTLKGSISDVNVDIIAHRYPYLQKPNYIEGISLLSEQDIIAMKLNAISISGQRSKDFIDIYYALNNYSISEMVSFYRKKYDQKSASHILKSLVYFDDIDLVDWPVMIKDPDLKWTTVKKRLEKDVMEFVGKE